MKVVSEETKRKISEALKRFHQSGSKKVSEVSRAVKNLPESINEIHKQGTRATQRASAAVKKKAEETLSKVEAKVYKSKGTQKESSGYANELMKSNIAIDELKRWTSKDSDTKQPRAPSKMTFEDKLKNKVNEGLYHTKRAASSFKDKVKQKLKK